MPTTTAAGRIFDLLHQRHIPALDGVRMIAVFLVILMHFGLQGVPGAHGVMIFFVLSGFLITWLLLQEYARTETVSLRGFYRRRLLRIFPAFYAFWLLIVAMRLVSDRPLDWAHAWSAFFYVSNYYSALNGHPENIFSHTWSLAVEEQFYLLWPLVFLLCRRNLQRMTRLLVALIVAVNVHRIVLSYVFEVPGSYVYSAFDTRIDHLLIGCLLAVVLQRRLFQSFWTAACSHPAAPLVTIGLLLFSIFVAPPYVLRYRHVVGYAVEPMLMAVFLVQAVALSGTRWWSWLDLPPVRFLGRISYSLYLYQQLTLYPVRRLLEGYPLVVQLVAALAVTIIVAAGSYYFVERPFLQWKQRAPVRRPREEPALALVPSRRHGFLEQD